MPPTSGAAVTSAFTPPARDRGRADSCPGALRPHLADDGALVRVRVPGGLLTVDQAQELASLAETFGAGHLDLTSRGNVQLRGLDPDLVAAVGQRLADAGLLPSPTHERARNIVASPLAGLDGRGFGPATDWARALDRLLCADDRAAALSGRFLFALDDGRADVAALGADITLTARPDGAAALRLGPAATGRDLLVPAAHAPRWALRAALLFLSLTGHRPDRTWRVTDLGPDLATLHDRLAEAITTEHGAIPNGDGREAEAGFGTAPGSAALRRATASAGGPPVPGIVTRPNGGGPAAVCVAAALGRLTAAQWRTAARLAADGVGEVRVTPWRGVVLPGFAADRAARALAALDRAGFVTRPDSPWHGVTACTGRPGCARSLADVRADATTALGGRPTTDAHHSTNPDRSTDAHHSTNPAPPHGPAHPHGRGANRPATPADRPATPANRPGAGADPPVLPANSPVLPADRPATPAHPHGPGANRPATPADRPATPADRPGAGADSPVLPVHWSGCDRRCGHPGGTGWVDVLATPEGYLVGRAGAGRPLARSEVPAAVAAARRSPLTETT